MKRRHKKHRLVTLWDLPSNTFTRIPESELAPGMVSCHVPGHKGVVWREAVSIDLKDAPYRHPPFSGEMRSLIESMVDAFPGIMEWSYEKWEDLLRKDTNPRREIDYWLIVARVFAKFSQGQPPAYRMEVFRLLTVCNVTFREALPMVYQKDLLPTDVVDAIVNDYYGHFVR
jgi:hypothetical protein